MPNAQTIKVLVIDDDEDDFFIIQDLLKQLGPNRFSVDWAPNFDKGFEQICEKGHHIYLIDHLLGSETGLTLIAKAIQEGCRGPMVLLTGVGNRDLDIQAIHVGADDYLPKSLLSTEILERTIRHAMERFSQRIEIEAERQKYKQLFDQSNDPIYVTNSQWIGQDANDAFFTLFGISRDEFGSWSLEKLFAKKGDYLTFIENSCDGQVYAPGVPVELRSKDGRHISALIASAPVKSGESVEIIAHQVTFHDITRLKNMEDELQVIEKINLTGRMIRNIAHDVRNPLTNINLAIDQLKMDLGDDNPDVEIYLDIVNRNSARINALITTLLNNTRTAQASLELESVESVLLEALDHCSDRFQLKSIDLETKGLDSDNKILLDREKLQIAFTNIITNAIEAMETQRSPKLSLECRKTNQHVEIRITDNGKGMSPETLEKLFDPFYTARPGGLGLGMTAVKQLISLHNGEIHVESILNEGSTFAIHLPLAS